MFCYAGSTEVSRLPDRTSTSADFYHEQLETPGEMSFA